MQPPVRDHGAWHSKLLVVPGVAATPLLWGAHAPSRAQFGALAEPLPRYIVVIGEARALPNQRCLLIIAVFLCSVIGTLAQEPTPTPQTAVPAGVTTEEVILTSEQVI